MSSRIRLGDDRPIGFLERDGNLLILFWSKNHFITRMLDVESSQLVVNLSKSSDFETLNDLEEVMFLDSIETNSTHELFILGKTTGGRRFNRFELYNLMIPKSITDRNHKSNKVSIEVYPSITAKAGSHIDLTSLAS